MNKRTVFITGVSSGIGLESLLLLAKQNFFVIGTVRDNEKKAALMQIVEEHGLGNCVDLFCLDITNETQVGEVVSEVIKKYQRIDILINNAGYCLGGFAEEVSMSEWRKQFDTNVFGTIAVTKSFLPHMREHRSGRIIVVSSIIGRIGIPSMSPYASSKFALKGFVDSLRLELLRSGVEVTAVEPGSYKTKIWDKGLEGIQDDLESSYSAERTAISKLANQEFRHGGNPKEVATCLLSLCQKKRVRKQYIAGFKMKVFVALFQFLPSSLLETYLKKQYAKGERP